MDLDARRKYNQQAGIIQENDRTADEGHGFAVPRNAWASAHTTSKGTFSQNGIELERVTY